MAPVPGMDELSLEATLIEGEMTVKRNPGGPQEEGVYAYLYYESEGQETRRFASKENYVIVGRVDPQRGITHEIVILPIDPCMHGLRHPDRIPLRTTFFY